MAPALADLTGRVVFGDLWRRADLSLRDRSLATVAGLVAAGDTAHVGPYVTLALRNGVTREQLGEAITNLAFYAGWARATSAAAVIAGVEAAVSRAPAALAALVVTRAGSGPATGAASNFTGTVTVTAAFNGLGASQTRGASVTFAPGARTNWHTHPLGQTLVVIQGHAWVQQEGGSVVVLGVGDTVVIPPGVKHWHGAAADEAMTHIAITEALDGKAVDWMEPVTDAQYRAGRGR